MAAGPPEKRKRESIVKRLQRLHASVDSVRCEQMVVDADLDVVLDEVLERIDVVLETLPWTGPGAVPAAA